jgi:hypothetical protein
VNLRKAPPRLDSKWRRALEADPRARGIDPRENLNSTAFEI